MFISAGNLPSAHITYPDEEKSLAKHVLATIMVSLHHV